MSYLSKEKCKRGHLIGDNPYIAPDGQRECRKCKKERAKKWYLNYRRLSLQLEKKI